jgi:hypothetical protein
MVKQCNSIKGETGMLDYDTGGSANPVFILYFKIIQDGG